MTKTNKYLKKTISWLLFISLLLLTIFIVNQAVINKPNTNTLLALKTDKIQIGAFVGTNPPTPTSIKAFEKLTKRRLNSIMWFEGWDENDQPEFPRPALDKIVSAQVDNSPLVLNLTWEPAVDLKDIISGTHDNYIESYAKSIKDWGGEVRFRYAHEMIQDDMLNGEEFYRWQDQPEDYVKAFRHVHNIFNKIGADNTQFVWCPNNFPFDVNVVKKYYPGIDYVDWLCMDGYNWGKTTSKPDWRAWLWFDDIFANLYHTYVDHPEIFGKKPIMLGEFSSCEATAHDKEGQNKAEWIKNAFERLASPDFKMIKAFHWFQINKECDWRIDSSDATKTAFKDAMKSDHFISSH